MEGFVREAGAALHTVTGMTLMLRDTCGSAAATAALSEALCTLVSACPSLKTLTSHGPMSPEFLHSLGQTCPQLSALKSHATSKDLPSLQRVVQLLPSLLPQLTSLTLLAYNPSHTATQDIPDMSGCTGVLSLDMSKCSISILSHWPSLPPNLQHLRCSEVTVGPSAGLVYPLSSLISVTVEQGSIGLNVLALLLRVAPALQLLQAATVNDAVDPSLIIDCTLDCPSTSASLSFVNQQMGRCCLQHSAFAISYGTGWDRSLIQPSIAAMPCMISVTRCIFNQVDPEDLPLLLQVFPIVQHLTLSSPQDTDDIGIQDLTLCSRLSCLELEFCNHVSPMGLVSLCQRLPMLRHVICDECDLLRAPDLARCQKLLRRHGLEVEMVCADMC